MFTKNKVFQDFFMQLHLIYTYLCTQQNNSIMLPNIKKIFLNEKIILSVIIINTLVVFIQESGINYNFYLHIDNICLIFFCIEIIIKIKEYGLKKYFNDTWNRMDFILVMLSIPSLLTLFINFNIINLSALLTLRLLRILRIFRIFHFFPNITQITIGFKRGLKQSRAILLSFVVIIVVTGIINCCIFKNLVPEYFSTPLRSIYTIFRIFTVEGWYEIPDAIASATSPFWGSVSRLYFCLLLCAGGIIGMSFINSVFVDAMIEDNNDDLKIQLNNIEKKLDEIQKKIDSEN